MYNIIIVIILYKVNYYNTKNIFKIFLNDDIEFKIVYELSEKIMAIDIVLHILKFQSKISIFE